MSGLLCVAALAGEDAFGQSRRAATDSPTVTPCSSPFRQTKPPATPSEPFGGGDMPIRLATRLLLALTTLGPLTAPTASAQARDRVENVAGWRIISGPSSDGGHDVRLIRRGRGYVFDHLVEYWRGNGGVSVHDDYRRGRCNGAGEDGILPFRTATSRARLDRQLAAYLRACPLPAGEAAALRRSLVRAWPAYLRHVRRARAAMDANNRAIGNDGR
jgi:hypothetical protein